MASDVTQRVDSCACYPDFAACCFFIEKFGELLGLLKLDINNLCEAFEDCSAGILNNLLIISAVCTCLYQMVELLGETVEMLRLYIANQICECHHASHW